MHHFQLCVSDNIHRPLREYRIHTHAHRVWLTLIGKMDNPMIAHHTTPDYDQCLRHHNLVQPGERVQLHQVLNHRPKLNHILQINRLQKDGDDLRYKNNLVKVTYFMTECRKLRYLKWRLSPIPT